MIINNKTPVDDIDVAMTFEWLETNGLGGWASSTITGAHTRRYHGLLVAATKPPEERFVLLSKLEEVIVMGSEKIQLGSNLFPGNKIYPEGHKRINNFSKDIFPEWVYETGELRIRKSLIMVNGENTTIILYKVEKASTAITMQLFPLVAGRFYHDIGREGSQLYWDVSFENDVFHNKTNGSNDLFINVPGSKYHHDPKWYYNFQYPKEQYRGLEYTEDLLNHGIIEVDLKQGEIIGIIISTNNPAGRNAVELFDKEVRRRTMITGGHNQTSLVSRLRLAADQFIVQRDENLKTVIAGYHWFTDWGRDTMISLPGLCLATGRIEDAQKILAAFARSVSEGMLPNRFQDNGKPPEFNNVDGTLWFFIAVYKYLEAGGDATFIRNEIIPVLKEIIDWHQRGTRYKIHEQIDGLLYAGETGVQLTWMDAKVGDWVVTPRIGKPVEIQALWYNALMILKGLLEMDNDNNAAAELEIKISRTRKSFDKKFWNEKRGCLYDVITDESNDDTIRPNQLFAISLPFSLLTGKKAKSVLEKVANELYTPVGLRSLSPLDSSYVGHYGGDPLKRDSSYHQGTVWSWLLGAYIESTVKIFKRDGITRAQKILQDFNYHLDEGCIGSISEIFDGEPPHYPRGCVAQAWSVGELLRVINEYDLSADHQANELNSYLKEVIQ